MASAGRCCMAAIAPFASTLVATNSSGDIYFALSKAIDVSRCVRSAGGRAAHARAPTDAAGALARTQPLAAWPPQAATTQRVGLSFYCATAFPPHTPPADLHDAADGAGPRDVVQRELVRPVARTWGSCEHHAFITASSSHHHHHHHHHPRCAAAAPPLRISEPFRTLRQFTDPPLNACRGLLPPVGGIDLSPMLLFFGLSFLSKALRRLAMGV